MFSASGFLPGRRADLVDLSQALTDLLGVPVQAREERRGIAAITEAATFSDDPEQPEVGVCITSSGQFKGRFLLMMRPQDARRVGRLLGEGDAPAEAVLDACREVATIIAGHYLTAVERLAGEVGTPSPPASAVDMMAAIVQDVVSSAGDLAVASLFSILLGDDDGPMQLRLLVLRDSPV